MNDTEKIQFLGEELCREVTRVNKLLPLIKHLYDMVAELSGKDYDITFNETRFRNTRNEVTYLHNEVNEIKKVLGLDGSVPKKQVSNKYKFT